MLKRERERERVHRTHYRTRDEARADLFDYLEWFHNPRMRRRVARRNREFQALIKPSVETAKTLTACSTVPVAPGIKSPTKDIHLGFKALAQT